MRTRTKKVDLNSTRSRIVDAASAEFRRNGIHPVGLVAIMKIAGLTKGAFYNYFTSKEDLVSAALGDNMLDVLQTDSAHVPMRTSVLERAIQYCLSQSQRDNPDTASAAAALASEVSREPVPTRRVFSSQINERIELIASSLDINDETTRSRRAVAIFALMTGALQMARIETDQVASDAILTMAATAVRELAKHP